MPDDLLTWQLGTGQEQVCPLCQAHGIKPHRVRARHMSHASKLCDFYQCSSCGSLLHLDSILGFEHSQTGHASIFLRQYLEHSAGPWEMFWPVAMLATSAGPRTLLDVGCGFGFTVDLWRGAFSAEAWGCDPAAYAEVGRRLLGPHILPCLLEDAPELLGRCFDIVYASEVIEHVDDPHAFVRLLSARLNPGGVLVLTTPSAEFVRPEHDPATVHATLAPGFHAFLFSEVAFGRLLHEAGFAHVIVERHQERLLAWASQLPIERGSVDAAIRPYQSYLLKQASGLRADVHPEQASLRAGMAYRAYKDCLLRGAYADLPLARSLALRHGLLIEEAGMDHPGHLLAEVEAVQAGVSAWGERYRYCLPQVAYCRGIEAADLEGDHAQAVAWLDLMQAATEKLCADTALANLEAASFYWDAECRLLVYAWRQGEYELSAGRLQRLLKSLHRPWRGIGGSSPSPERVASLLLNLPQSLPVGHDRSFLLRVTEYLDTLAQAESDRSIQSLYRFARAWLMSWVAMAAEGLDPLAAAYRELSERTGRLASLMEEAVQRRLAERSNKPNLISFSSPTYGSIRYR